MSVVSGLESVWSLARSQLRSAYWSLNYHRCRRRSPISFQNIDVLFRSRKRRIPHEKCHWNGMQVLLSFSLLALAPILILLRLSSLVSKIDTHIELVSFVPMRLMRNFSNSLEPLERKSVCWWMLDLLVVRKQTGVTMLFSSTFVMGFHQSLTDY